MKPPTSIFQIDTPEDSPGFVLWQVSNLWQRRMNSALQAVDITHVQFVLLANIAWFTGNNETVTQIQLATQAKTDVMMTSKVLRTLEQKNLIIRETNPTDTRAKSLTLTSSGYQLLIKAVKIVEQVDNNFFASLQSHISQFNTLLLSLVDNNSES
ncbi:MarR family winged helix-turn-helix transcriptional regulator [Candidatus Chloroploca sp. Khr17]|uniref:MarR family winged helix-turn-helix transcriptional regulator n=1 Tax=Candidatus Chloroploca sp. Khr17 TaxID=2496869 RepID=UPI00101CEF74|nr:MarR family transcriptional regulator [Candidatus Chloroploca sp. Khr17]